MPYKILILGASYGSLLGTKLAAAGHDVTLVCRAETAALINAKGTEVRIKLRDEDAHRSFFSGDLAGKTDATTPEDARPEDYDLVCLAMQEPQYSHPTLVDLLSRIAKAKVACMSIMNMPPLPYLKRIPGLDCSGLQDAFLNAGIWEDFDPKLMTLCSPDPQAFRPPEEKPNVLHVGLPTNFKVSKFDDPKLDAMLTQLETGIDDYRVDGKDVPVKLRVFDSLFVPFAKWAMLATGNYRCITKDGPQAIRDAVHGDIAKSQRDLRLRQQRRRKARCRPRRHGPVREIRSRRAEPAQAILCRACGLFGGDQHRACRQADQADRRCPGHVAPGHRPNRRHRRRKARRQPQDRRLTAA